MAGIWEPKGKNQYELNPASAAFPQGRAAFFCPTYFGHVLRQSRQGHHMQYDPELAALLTQDWSEGACRGYVILVERGRQSYNILVGWLLFQRKGS